MSELVVEILENCLGNSKKHNSNTCQISFDCPVCSHEIKGLDKGDGKGNLEVNYIFNVFKCWACSETHDTHGTIYKLIKNYGNSDLLKKYNQKFASINGATQIRAGVIRPEIVIPLSEENINKSSLSSSAKGIQKGSLVRVIRAPHFGSMGKVLELPTDLQKMESETMVRVAIIKIDGEDLTIPRSNLEMVETD